MELVLPSPCLVLLVGASGSGKSTWARGAFPAHQIVSSDALREVVASDARDMSASADAMALLDTIVEQRLGRGLTAVIDSTGLEDRRRAGWRSVAARHDVPVVAIVIDTPAAACRARNRVRLHPVPAAVVDQQLRRLAEVRTLLPTEGYHDVIVITTAATDDDPVTPTVAPIVASATISGAPGRPHGLRFGLQISSFTFEGGAAGLGPRLRELAHLAEAVGFESIWVMDHLRQIPQVGPAWSDLPEAWTTLAHLAATTKRIRLGTLVTSVTLRPIALLAKQVATLDVLSGGRAMCGLGTGWFEQEATAVGVPFPSLAHRYAVLEDALQALPLLWGKGTPAFAGRTVQIAEALCYPRPLQAKVPILVGGGGERRTLQLVARYADACNLFGERDAVAHKVAVLRDHCRSVGRDPAEIEITQLSTTLVAHDRAELESVLERQRPRGLAAERYARMVNAGTIGQQHDRFAALAAAGVGTAIVSLPDLGTEAIERFAPVIAAAR